MTKVPEWSRDLFRGLILATLPLIMIAIVVVSATWRLFGMGACVTETRSTISVAGLDFQIEETDCDTLAKDASISVYGFNEAGREKTLLFRYGPASYHLPLPAISVPDQRTITISVPVVSDVDFQLNNWNDHSIRYEIGHIDYPTPPGREPARQ